MKQLIQKIIIAISFIGFLFIALYPIVFGSEPYNEYIKDYSSLIFMFLTYIYVLLTFLILNSNNKLSKEQLRPYVIASFNRIDNFVYFSVKNYGKRPALNTIIKMTKGFEELQFQSIKGNYHHLLEQKFLAPGQEIKTLVSDPASIVHPKNKVANKCFDFNIEYYDTDRTKYDLDYKIYFNNQYANLTIQDTTITSTLKHIHEEIKELNKRLMDYIKEN